MNIKDYLNLPLVKWDGESPIYSDVTDRIYRDIDEAESDLGEGQTLIDLRLMPTSPEYVTHLDSSYCEDSLPDDGYGELPVEVEMAMDAFNKAVEGIVISWSPWRRRLDV